MKLIIGLGNPGLKYRKTRHNVGFMVLDNLAKDLGVSFSKKSKLNARVIETNIVGEKVILAKPTTFMNNSGKAVAALKEMYKVENSDIWIVFDDATLEFGKLRIREQGSAGGHNGIKSIIKSLKSDEFSRFKIGVGSPPEYIALEDWVLSKFTKDQKKVLKDTITKAADQIKEQI